MERQESDGTPGVAGERDWTMERKIRSPHYTTRWTDLPVVQA